METSNAEITKLRISYLKSVSELDIEDIGEINDSYNQNRNHFYSG